MLAGLALCMLLECRGAIAQGGTGESQTLLWEDTIPVLPATASFEETTAALVQPADPPPEPDSTREGAAIAAGQAAFERSCTDCHGAERALGKAKDYAGWLATIRRMAGKDGADIQSGDTSVIAAYLASVAGPASVIAGGGEAGGWSFGTTVSTLHRSASDESSVEHPGFFADVWVTASYQSTGAWRATVTACTSCHTSNGAPVELVEGSATLDLRHMFNGCRCDDGREVLLKTGRFVVPFGAYSTMSHPGISRTVTSPLMFNMGRRVFVPGASPPRQPLLLMPFADEGVDLAIRTPVGEFLTFTADLYAVNGLQGANPNIFLRSRSYFDNNEEPSGGARITLGGDRFRLGASVLGGNLQDQGLPKLYYTLEGADATFQVMDRLRFYFEYARRRQDSGFVPDTEENTYGTVTELELKVWNQPNVSLLVRYDTLDTRHPAFGDASVRRMTTGINIGLPGGSLLMVNHERWMPEAGEDVDLVGARWVVSL